MNRSLAVLAIALVPALSLSACGGDDEETTTTTSTAAATGASGATGDAAANPVAADAEAKASARTTQTVVETLATDHNGSYADITVEDLAELEPSASDAELESTADTYSITVESASGNAFTVERQAAGSITMTCVEPGVGGCDENGEW